MGGSAPVLAGQSADVISQLSGALVLLSGPWV